MISRMIIRIEELGGGGGLGLHFLKYAVGTWHSGAQRRIGNNALTLAEKMFRERERIWFIWNSHNYYVD